MVSLSKVIFTTAWQQVDRLIQREKRKVKMLTKRMKNTKLLIYMITK
jgi:hypothetical protein